MPLGANKAGLFGAAGASGAAGDRGVFGGTSSYESSPAESNSIEYITISSTGNGADFGDMSSIGTREGSANGTSGGRGVWDSGRSGSPFEYTYVTIQTLGNSADFGDYDVNLSGRGSMSNGSNDRGMWVGGRNPTTTNSDECEYITLSSAGNGTDFGNLVEGRSYAMQASSNGTDERGIMMGGEGSPSDSAHQEIDYFTISSTGNASDFGDMSTIHKSGGSTSNDTNDRMVTAGGNRFSNETTLAAQYDDFIDYITITSTGNSTDFGNLVEGAGYPGSVSNGVNERGVFYGGHTYDSGYGDKTVIDYITINSTGNASDFGDIVVTGHVQGGIDDCQA